MDEFKTFFRSLGFFDYLSVFCFTTASISLFVEGNIEAGIMAAGLALLSAMLSFLNYIIGCYKEMLNHAHEQCNELLDMVKDRDAHLAQIQKHLTGPTQQ